MAAGAQAVLRPDQRLGGGPDHPDIQDSPKSGFSVRREL